MSEPYQELDPRKQARAVTVLRRWAAAQEDPAKPILEFLDGTSLTPQDLLEEPAPIEGPPRGGFGLAPRLRRTVRRAQGRKPGRAWTHMLNLVAVSEFHGEDTVESLLAEIAGDAEADAGPEAKA